MENEVKTETADSVENTAQTTVNEPSNISHEDFVEKRLEVKQKQKVILILSQKKKRRKQKNQMFFLR